MRFLMSFMRWKLIAGAALIAAVVIGCNFAIRWSNARLIQKNQEWNARIDWAGLRYATPQQVMAYLRHEHLPFAVYHDDLSIIIVKAPSRTITSALVTASANAGIRCGFPFTTVRLGLSAT